MTELTKWAKVIDLDNGNQVLYYQEYDPSQDKYIIHRICNVNDIRMDAAFTRTKEFTQEEFDKVATKENAVSLVEVMLRGLLGYVRDNS